jgi:hypothetical protein
MYDRQKISCRSLIGIYKNQELINQKTIMQLIGK